MKPKIAVVGLGYVGLPLALELAKHFEVIGYDCNKSRIKSLDTDSEDINQEINGSRIEFSEIVFTFDKNDIADCNFYIVCVPTPITSDKKPLLKPIEFACNNIKNYLDPNDIVVFESTVYPGMINQYCKKMLPSRVRLGYSPERINPGDTKHTLSNTTKIISANDLDTLAEIEKVYSKICPIYRAQSIEVAEAAKVIENIQRDINIALMNELAMIFDKIGIDTNDVLDAAATKWNFHKYKPGLVGGHCIPVDPYYLAACAESHGYKPRMILAGRDVNESMAKFIAEKTLKIAISKELSSSHLAIVGLTFKEDVSDIRNSMSFMIEKELREYGYHPIMIDPFIRLHNLSLSLAGIGIIILAVPHKCIMNDIYDVLNEDKENCRVLIDVKGAIDKTRLPSNITYWRL